MVMALDGMDTALRDKLSANFGPGLLAIVAGLALAASFPPLDQGPVAWLALWPLLIAIRDRSAFSRALLGGVAGIVWTGSTVFLWLYPAAQTHLASSPSIAAAFAAAATWFYGGIYLCALALVHPWLPRPRWLAVPAAWVLLEAVREMAFGGAPWGLLGHSQHDAPYVAQLAELAGVAGVSFVVLMPAAALAESGAERRHGLLAWTGVMVAVLSFGMLRIAAYDEPNPGEDGTSIRLVGGRNLAADPLAAYVSATMDGPSAALTVWPESAVPAYVQEQPDTRNALATLARDRGWLLLGTLRYEGRGDARRYLNSAMLLDPSGATVATYAKTHLVPFAERSPWPFPSLVRQPFAPGPRDGAPLRIGDLRLGILICWEAIFAQPTRHYARQGVDVLVNLTSDLDLGWGTQQMLAFSRFRAIESRRWLLRVSGTGDTLAVDPIGRLSPRTELRIAREETSAGPYVRWGDWVPPAALALLALLQIRRRYER